MPPTVPSASRIGAAAAARSRPACCRAGSRRPAPPACAPRRGARPSAARAASRSAGGRSPAASTPVRAPARARPRDDAAHRHAHLAAQHRPARLGQRRARRGASWSTRASPAPPAGGTRRATRLRRDRRRCRRPSSASCPHRATRSLALAAQHVDQVHGAEALPGAVDRRQRLLRGARSRPRSRAARGRCRSCRRARCSSPKYASSRTRRQPAVSHRPSSASSLARRDALVRLGRLRLVDQPPLLDDVGEAVGHPRVRRQAVAAGAAGLLVVALDALRQVEMRDEAHVGLVDAHAEGDGGDHHDAVLALEARLVARRGSRCPCRRGRAARRRPCAASQAAVSSTLRRDRQ